MNKSRSLRSRLFTLILTPLVLLAMLLVSWRYMEARETAEDLFDRALLAGALSVSRDVAYTGGDLISPATRRLISEASGGEIFYHVSGPEGIYITGYAYPPNVPKDLKVERYEPRYFEAIYRDEPVRVLRIIDISSYEHITGDTQVTVWQRLSQREAFARTIAIKAAGLLIIFLGTLAFVVWFGVNHGLAPLTDLRHAIDARSPDDLSTIKRPVPKEVQAIVEVLNRLFGQVEKSINAHQAFISDAAHQLRNPANAVHSMAEAARDAPSDEDRRMRVQELVHAARHSAYIAEQLLSMDRLRHGRLQESQEFDLRKLSRETASHMAAPILEQGLDFEFVDVDHLLMVQADPVMVSEALKNLITNAQKHGGDQMSKITVTVTHDGTFATVTVVDDGKGLSPKDQETAFSRFGQLEPTDGSGLGLAIASGVAEKFNGTLKINAVEQGASLSFSLPISS